MELKDYTTEELRAEISRRYAEKKAERDKIARCRMCKHWGTVDYWGRPVSERRSRQSNCCPFYKTKNGKHYLVYQSYQLACEHFEKGE